MAATSHGWIGNHQHPWNQLPCLPYDERSRLGFSVPKGYLSDNSRVETVLQGLLSLGPHVFLVCIAPLRVFQLYNAKLVTIPNYRGLIKALFSAALFVLQLAYTVSSTSRTAAPTLLAARSLSLLASIAVCGLSLLENGRSAAPSTILTVYLAVSGFSDIVKFGLLYVAKNLCSHSILPVAIFMVRMSLLVLEARTKTAILREPFQDLAPEETAGVFGTTFFWWVNKFIALGYSRILSIKDMPPLASNLDTMTIREDMQKIWDKRKRPEHQFVLVFAQFRLTWYPNIVAAIPRALLTIFRYCQPLLIARTMAYVSSDSPPLGNRNEAFRLLLFAFITYSGMAISKGMYDIRLHRLNVMSRIAIVGLVHNRCLNIQDGVFDDAAAVTLISNDVEQTMFSSDLFHELWSQSLELCIGMYLLGKELGWVCIVPILVVALTSQGSKFVTVRFANRQKAVGMATQIRISMTKAILDSMKNIKMMGLIDKMESKIRTARRIEIQRYIDLNKLFVAFNASAMMLTILTPALTLIIYAIQAEIRGAKSIDVEVAFTSFAIIGLVTSPANTILIFITHVASALASFDRIQTYLTSPDREDKRQILGKHHTNGLDPTHSCDGSHSSTERTEVDDLAIVIGGATIRPASTADPVLRDLNTTITKGNLVVCSGAVGSGKTILVKALLGDLPPDTGTIKTAFGSIAYCSQTAWLINGTIKDNIRGHLWEGGDIGQAWYERVVHVCDLEEDLQQLPDGDQTVIGSRGITLSGGQKHRVALARAVYSRQTMIILDDVLSALDTKTESHIIEKLIGPKGLLKELGTTVLLITHAVAHDPDPTVQHLPLADYIIVLSENGYISEQGSWDDLRTKAGYISQMKKKERPELSEKPRNGNWVKNETYIPSGRQPDQDMQDLTRKTGDITLYAYYFGTIAWYGSALLLSSMTLYSLFLGFMPYWLRYWAESSGPGVRYYSTVYLLLAVGALASATMTIANTFLLIAPQSAKTLHSRLLHTVMAAPQSYFAQTDTGTTLNRFSADILMIDRRLPQSLLLVGNSFFALLSQAILLAAVQPLMTITLPATFLAVYFIQKFYLTTSRQLRFLDLETRALVNASFLETLEGVATIRAFGWQRQFIKDNAKRLDMSVRPWYLMMALQRWLNVVMDLMVLGIAMFVISFAVWRKDTTSGQIGIALNVVLQANLFLLRLVEAWTTIETSLGAVSRLRAFEKDVLPEEKPGEDYLPTVEWPAHGAIYFDHVSAAYRPASLVLRDITISIKPSQKVGICGRTGSGKSSLILSLLRLLDIKSGTIWIDDLDIRTLPRNSIRSRLITVPQDPMLVMTDTLRQNLDIADSAVSDEDIVQVLEKVKLWSVIQSRANAAEIVDRQAQELDAAMGGGSRAITIHGGVDASATASLDVVMKSLPLSQGQQQLFSLARALLMRPTRGKIVILDEATSSVDSETDKLMQRLIRDEFTDHTVLTVAHRMDTVMDSDLILVLDAGKLVEAGAPSELAEKEGGMFRALYTMSSTVS